MLKFCNIMFIINCLLFAICLQNVACVDRKKQPCEYTDGACVQQAIKQHVFSLFIAGMPGVEPSDPLHLESIKVDLPNLMYKLTEPTLTGFKYCQVQNLNLTKNEYITEFGYEFPCPHLTLQSDYELIILDPASTEDKGKCEINYNSYSLIFRGEYVKEKVENDNEYINITDYTVHLELQGSVTYKFESDTNDGKEKPDAYYKNLEEHSRQTIMEKFLDKLMYNVKSCLLLIPMQDFHFTYA